MEVGWEGFVLSLPAWMCTGFRDVPAVENANLGEGSRAESRWEKAHQKDILQRLIGVIGVQESEVVATAIRGCPNLQRPPVQG